MPQLDSTLFNTSGSLKFTFAGFPDAKILESETSSKWIQHLLFGDYITLLDTEIINNRVRVHSRNKTGWISIDNIQKNRTLEINFVDIGQGDGCHLITPDDQHYFIDAGKGDNMYRYLYWRFNLDENDSLPMMFKAIVSHPDNDHYLGFADIFEEPAIQFDIIYHSGIVHRPVDNTKGWNTQLGKVEELSDGEDYLLSLELTDAAMKSILNDPQNSVGTGSQYPETMALALSQQNQPTFTALNNQTGFLLGNGGANEFSLKVIAPILEQKDGNTVLPFLKNNGKTKNGHSVLLMLHYKHLRVMLGGDINEEAGEYINGKLGANANTVLQADIAKACHHGSHLFSYEFLENINALGTVISSGDDENYSHPRPDTLGAIGKTGYSKKPLIFSTELARSNKDFSSTTIPELVKKYQSWEKAKVEFEDFEKDFVDTPANQQELQELKEKMVKKYKEINSYLTRYGMISLRSDGDQMIVAQKLERDSRSSKYDIYEFAFDAQEQRFVRK
ncbi:ComEC/Rec2 family competence protein [Flagellimonas sp.]|uniref:ComEC/Rec2 family competence protein n=1 Tax=Flagellimonas sp. TaxID=2058762 RepID=UPI003B5AA74E